MAGEADELVVHPSGEAETAGMECGEEPGEALHGMTRQPNQFGGTAMVDPQRCFAVITECRRVRARVMPVSSVRLGSRQASAVLQGLRCYRRR